MKLGADLLALSGAAMVAYGIAFLIRNFTGFTELLAHRGMRKNNVVSKRMGA